MVRPIAPSRQQTPPRSDPLRIQFPFSSQFLARFQIEENGNMPKLF